MPGHPGVHVALPDARRRAIAYRDRMRPPSDPPNADSDPDAEWHETMNKGRALFRAVAQAAKGL